MPPVRRECHCGKGKMQKPLIRCWLWILLRPVIFQQSPLDMDAYEALRLNDLVWTKTYGLCGCVVVWKVLWEDMSWCMRDIRSEGISSEKHMGQGRCVNIYLPHWGDTPNQEHRSVGKSHDFCFCSVMLISPHRNMNRTVHVGMLTFSLPGMFLHCHFSTVLTPCTLVWAPAAFLRGSRLATHRVEDTYFPTDWMVFSGDLTGIYQCS